MQASTSDWLAAGSSSEGLPGLPKAKASFMLPRLRLGRQSLPLLPSAFSGLADSAVLRSSLMHTAVLQQGLDSTAKVHAQLVFGTGISRLRASTAWPVSITGQAAFSCWLWHACASRHPCRVPLGV